MHKFAVRSSDGSVDQTATLAKFSKELDSFLQEIEQTDGLIAEAVNSVLDETGGSPVAKDNLVNRVVLQKLNATNESYSMIESRVRQFVKENTGKTREDGKLLRSSRGTGGGICRWSDFSESTES